jgi:hypothetical protein
MARLAIFLALWGVLSGCGPTGPQLICHEPLSDEDCQTSIVLAEATLGDLWASVRSGEVFDGICSHWQIGCPPTRLEPSLGLFATVDVETQDGRRFSIEIDRRTEPWGASCNEFITTLGGRETHTKPCEPEASSPS